MIWLVMIEAVAFWCWLTGYATGFFVCLTIASSLVGLSVYSSHKEHRMKCATTRVPPPACDRCEDTGLVMVEGSLGEERYFFCACTVGERMREEQEVNQLAEKFGDQGSPQEDARDLRLYKND